MLALAVSVSVIICLVVSSIILMQRNSGSDVILKPKTCESQGKLGSYILLNGNDQMLASGRISFALRFKTNLNASRVKEALSKALDFFPFISGRLNRKQNIGQWRIDQYCAGIQFEVKSISLKNLKQPENSKDMALVEPYLKRRFLLSRLNDFLFFGRLTLLPQINESVLYVSLNHAVGDAASFYEFLKVWSDFVAGDAGRNSSELPSEYRKLGSPKFDSKEEIIDAMSKIDRCPLPIDKKAFQKALPVYALKSSISISGEFKVRKSKLQKWKEEISKTLPQNSWISSNELLNYLLAFSYEATAKRPRWGKNVNASIVVNIRERGRALFRKDFFGNAAVNKWLTFKMPLESDIAISGNFESILNAISPLVLEFHNSIRKKLLVNSNLSAEIDVLNAAQEYPEIGNKLCFSEIASHLEDENGRIFLNSWDAIPWLETLKFGAVPDGVESFFYGPTTKVAFNSFVFMPRNKLGDLTFNLMTGKDRFNRFLTILKSLDLPFEFQTKL